MKYLKIFEKFINEPKFFRFSHVNILGNNDIVEYTPNKRNMVGPDEFNQVLVNKGFPDKRQCIHFMDNIAFESNYLKSLYGEYTYQIEIDNNSKLGWSFFFPINDWFYKGNPFKREEKNPLLQDLLNSEYGKLNCYNPEDDEEIFNLNNINKMADLSLKYGVIGHGTIDYLIKSQFFNNQKLFAWTEDTVKVIKI